VPVAPLPLWRLRRPCSIMPLASCRLSRPCSIMHLASCRLSRPCSIMHLASCMVCLPTVAAVSCVGTEENCDLHQDSQCSGAIIEIRCFFIQWKTTVHNTTTICNPCSGFHNDLTLPVAVVSKKTFLYHTYLCVFHHSMRVATAADHINLSLCIINPTSWGNRHHGGMELEVYVFLTSILNQPIADVPFLYSSPPRNFWLCNNQH
jgi:hypothetical protein